MTQKLRTTTTYKQSLKTSLTRIQKQLLQYIHDMQPVHRKVIYLNAGSYAKSTIRENLETLKDKDMVTENRYGGFKTTEKGETQVSTSKTE